MFSSSSKRIVSCMWRNDALVVHEEWLLLKATGFRGLRMKKPGESSER